MLALSLLTAGCAGTLPTCKVPTSLEVELETSDRVNMDAEGQALPTLVRIYQLTDLSRFESALFEDMLENAAEVLGPTLVAMDELTMYPGQVGVRHLERNPKADFVVSVAVFRKPVGASWRSVDELPLPGDPCQEKNDEHAAPALAELRLRVFLEDYRIESVDNYRALPKRSCLGKADCKTGSASDELPDALRHRRLRTFEEDPSRPRPTVDQDKPQ